MPCPRNRQTDTDLSKLANITPQHFAFHGHDYHVNLDAFRGALLSQGIYDAQDADRELEPGGSSPMSPAASDNFPDSASGPYSQTRSEKTSTPATPSNHQEAPAQIVSLILRAAGEELPSSLVNRLFLKSKMPSKAQIALWDKRLVPLSRVIDPGTGFCFGKSIVAIWRRTAPVPR